ncbi:DUF317 domain-containing protein [Streptomyces cucumeris]|uniref:DUF317 domain-containing protein n=1 Tax=Streptomyces cucumeris TaxID=2962890 RepID=UPI003D745FAD
MVDPAPRRRAEPARLVRQLRRPHTRRTHRRRHRHAHRPGPAPTAIAPCGPYEPLRQAGWSPYGAVGLVSPDKAAYVECLGTLDSPPGAWFVTVTFGFGDPLWQARFGDRTPAHLVTAFTAALADPAPVARTDNVRCLPAHDPKVVTRQTTDVLAVDVASALEERVHTLAARRTLPPAKPDALIARAVQARPQPLTLTSPPGST